MVGAQRCGSLAGVHPPDPCGGTPGIDSSSLGPTCSTSLSRPSLGGPPQVPIDPAVLDPRHVPDQPGNIIGVRGGLSADLRWRQARNGAVQSLEVFLQSTPDRFFKGAHSGRSSKTSHEKIFTILAFPMLHCSEHS